MLPKIIYLDQNQWICLAQAYYGKNKDTEIIGVCKKVLDASESGRVLFPLSVIHMFETFKISNSERREKLFRFMVRVSRGCTIPPYYVMTDFEIKQAIRKRLGLNYTAGVKALAIGKGISHMMGVKPSITGIIPVLNEEQIKSMNLPESLKEEILKLPNSPNDAILKWMDSQDGLLWNLQQDETIKDIRENKIVNHELVKELEKIRSEDNKIKDKDLRYRVTLNKTSMLLLLPKIVRMHMEFDLPKDVIITEEWSKEDWLRLFEDIPTFFVPFILTDRRDRDWNRPIKENDFNDICAFSIAIPYCDIVVTEHMFAAIAKQAKLDKTYNTVIVSSIKELQNYI